MDKRAIFDHYSRILDNLIENNVAFRFYFQDPFSWDESFLMPFNPNWVLNCGATRVCIEDETYDYVIKIDLANWDSCEEEVGIYEAAREANLSQYFTEVEYIGTYCKTYQFYDMQEIELELGFEYYNFEERFYKIVDNCGELHDITIELPLYAYRRAIPHNYNAVYNELGEAKESDNEIIARSSKSPLTERNLAVGIEFIKQYGVDEFLRLSDFLEDNYVNDLHCGNFGDIDNRIVCIDYAGYHNPDYSDYEEEY